MEIASVLGVQTVISKFKRKRPSFGTGLFSKLRLISMVFFAGALQFMLRGVSCGQDRLVLFDTSALGVFKPIPNWGLDTAWLSEANIRRGIAFMGTDRIDVVRISFTPTAPLVNGELQPTHLTVLNQRLAFVDLIGSHVKLYINEDSPTVDPWFKDANGYVIPERWAALIEATAKYAYARGRRVLSVAPFNEPDFYRADRLINMQTFYETAARLATNSLFVGMRICGGNTLNTDQSSPWFEYLKNVLQEGNTHALAGSFDNYVRFILNVLSTGKHIANDELHNLGEAIIGAEYGLQTGIWWGTAERARGEFVKASDGMRLGYAEDRNRWTAAAVYRGPDGKVRAFVGESERMAFPTHYRFFCVDQDVFYDGYGPRRFYDVHTTGGEGYQTEAHRNAEVVINIAWGEDVQPPIDGRYVIVNRNSLKVMEVANASTNNGANIRQATYTGALHQQWDVIPLPYTNGGDYSYFMVTAAHSGKAADVYNWSLEHGGNVVQWENYPGVNQQWFLEYVSNGWFYIRSRWSSLYLEVANGSTNNWANIQQGRLNPTNSVYQQWRLVPVGANPIDTIPPSEVTGLLAIPNSHSVQLIWSPVTDPDLAGYTVLRSATSTGPFTIVARGLTNNVWVDNSANMPQSYYYAVRAEDRSLNTSRRSVIVSAAPLCRPALIAHYNFDGSVCDASANANHPIYVSASPKFSNGRFHSAISFDGTNQYIMLPATVLAPVTNFTIALWVNWSGGGVWQRIFDFGNGTMQNMFLTPRSGSGTLRFAITTNGNSAELRLDAAALSVGRWQHIAITYDGVLAKLYTNGNLAAMGVVNINPASFRPVLNYLGKSQYQADPLFNGLMDEVYIFNYALRPEEIQALMNGQRPLPDNKPMLSVRVDDDQLFIYWSADYLGWRLQSQASPLLTGLAGDWEDTPGTQSTNFVVVSMSSLPGCVFYRLVYSGK